MERLVGQKILKTLQQCDSLDLDKTLELQSNAWGLVLCPADSQKQESDHEGHCFPGPGSLSIGAWDGADVKRRPTCLGLV